MISAKEGPVQRSVRLRTCAIFDINITRHYGAPYHFLKAVTELHNTPYRAAYDHYMSRTYYTPITHLLRTCYASITYYVPITHPLRTCYAPITYYAPITHLLRTYYAPVTHLFITHILCTYYAPIMHLLRT